MMTPNGTESKAESMEPLDNCDNGNRGGGRKLLPHRSVISVRHRGCEWSSLHHMGPKKEWEAEGAYFISPAWEWSAWQIGLYMYLALPRISGNKVVSTSGWALTPFPVAVPCCCCIQRPWSGSVPSVFSKVDVEEWGAIVARSMLLYLLSLARSSPKLLQAALSKRVGFDLFSCLKQKNPKTLEEKHKFHGRNQYFPGGLPAFSSSGQIFSLAGCSLLFGVQE